VDHRWLCILNPKQYQSKADDKDDDKVNLAHQLNPLILQAINNVNLVMRATVMCPLSRLASGSPSLVATHHGSALSID